MDEFDIKGSPSKELIERYHALNETKKSLEKDLDSLKNEIKSSYSSATKQVLYGYKVEVTYPDTSKFDNDKVIDFLQNCLRVGMIDKDDFDTSTTLALNEEGLTDLINSGKIVFDALKDYAWVESKGSARLTVTKLKDV
jgi:hypothetical protein